MEICKYLTTGKVINFIYVVPEEKLASFAPKKSEQPLIKQYVTTDVSHVCPRRLDANFTIVKEQGSLKPQYGYHLMYTVN